jgi:hypothetical protein
MNELDQYKAESAIPNPKSTINSYRSFGYNLSTSIADIVDNSISANAKRIYIDFIWKGSSSSISIIDDGNGMSLDELIIAMTPGSKNPDDKRDEKDLGRFGMGLKTASFSQCKSLTVITKKENVLNFRCWDLDYINNNDKWVLLNYSSSSENIKKVESLTSGTMVVWEKMDRIVGESREDNETVKNAFYTELKTVSDHLSLVFHKYIEQKKIIITINGNILLPWNPFLLDLNPKPEMGPTEIISKGVNVTYYILPHMSRITPEAYQKSGGPLGWHNQQGFYVYRSDRLLVAGDWLGLEKKRDFNKLARIEINFSNDNDFNWNLDIKKSVAYPPLEIRKDLTRIAKDATLKSAKIYNWRSSKALTDLTQESKIQRAWYDETNRDGIKKYKINRNHPLVKEILQLDNEKSLIAETLKIIEENIPLDLILYNQNEDPSFHESEKFNEIPNEHIIKIACELYKIKISQGVPEELSRQQIMSSSPFNLYPIILDYLK